MANKYHYDVKNCYTIPGTLNADGTITYDNAKARQEPGLRSMEMQPQGETNTIRADGIDYIIYNSNNGYNGTLNFVQISDEFKERHLAEKKDLTTGIQYEDADAMPEPFALMGEFKGDMEGIRWIFYNCTAARPNVAGDNKEDQKQPDEESLSVTVKPVPVEIDGKECNIVKGGVKKSDNATTYNQWFTKVCLPGVATS